MEIYLDINKKALKDSFNAANKRAIDRDGDEGKENVLYDEIKVDNSEVGFNPKTMEMDFAGDIISDKIVLGYASGSIKLDFEDIIAIIELYRKKLGKVKTILEATD